MNYTNGKDIFPPELLDLIQYYAQGKYVYIPKRDENKEKWGTKTSYKKELKLRNSHIYTKYLTGLSVTQLSNKYCLSNKSVKRILLEKRKGVKEMNEIIEKLLKSWNINSEIKQIYDTAWSVGDNYVIKANNDLESLNRNITLMRTLNECGIPVAHPIPTIVGQDYVEANEKYYLMMNKLSGTHILDIYEEDYITIAYATGKGIAKLHTAFIACEEKITCWDNSLLDEMSGWIRDTLEINDYKYLKKIDFDKSLNDLNECYNKLQRQLIHRDLHFGNLLFNNCEFSGYIDFDLSQKNIRIFDICYFLLGLLIDHEKSTEHIDKWYNIVSKFIEGYEMTNPLTNLEKESICCIMSSIELLFVAYFISNEDELLAQGAANLYYFVNENQEKIQYAINNYGPTISYKNRKQEI